MSAKAWGIGPLLEPDAGIGTKATGDGEGNGRGRWRRRRQARHESARLRDLWSDLFGTICEHNSRPIVLSRLVGIAQLFRGRPGTERRV